MTQRNARPMSVLLATDESPQAKLAEQVVAHVRWPAGTKIVALRVDELMRSDEELPWQAYVALHADIRKQIGAHLARLDRQLSVPGREVETALVPGRPATVIVDEARARGVDLIVLGSRGHGQFASAVLGSVAAEVVDHAPCPVLVARRPAVRGIVVADDGSDGSVEAEEVLGSWPFVRALPTTVVSVAERVVPFDSGMAIVDPVTYQTMADEVIELHRGYARDGAARLAAHGCPAKAQLREGDPVAELIAAAADAKADVIAVGSRGQTGLQRLLLGSVARNVLFRSPTSVLIVRQKVQLEKRSPRPSTGKRKIARRARKVRRAVRS